MGMKNSSIQLSFRDKRVRHKRGRNATKYRGECSGMDDHFNTGVVFEISKFDISKKNTSTIIDHRSGSP